MKKAGSERPSGCWSPAAVWSSWVFLQPITKKEGHLVQLSGWKRSKEKIFIFSQCLWQSERIRAIRSLARRELSLANWMLLRFEMNYLILCRSFECHWTKAVGERTMQPWLWRFLVLPFCSAFCHFLHVLSFDHISSSTHYIHITSTKITWAASTRAINVSDSHSQWSAVKYSHLSCIAK